MAEGTINIRVKTLQGGQESSVTVDIPPTATVLELKDAVALTTTVPASSQRLIYQGKVLKDEEPITTYNLQDGSCVLMTASGAARAAPTTQTAAAPLGATVSPSLPAQPAPGPSSVSPVPQAAPAPATVGPVPAQVTILRAAVAGVRSSNTPDVARTALQTVSTIIQNIIQNPHEQKYRTLKKNNAAFQRRVGSVSGCGALLRSAGFAETAETWELTPSAEAWEVITSAKAEVDAVVAQIPAPAPAPVASPFGAPGMMPPMPPGLGGGGMPPMNPQAMSGMLQMLQQNPQMLQQTLAQIRQVNPAMAPQAEALLRNPAALQQLQSAMQNPAVQQQMASMMAQGGPGGLGGYGMGGMPPAMGGFPVVPPQPGQQGAQPPGSNDQAMTEDEMIAEAIARSLREM